MPVVRRELVYFFMIRGIECMLALDDTRHFGAAARKLGISQPSLSQAIAALERDMGLRLVLRTRTFEGFTPAGEVVIAQGQRVLRAMKDLRDMVDRCRPDATRRFAIGIIPITTFVAPLLSALLIQHHPAASLVVEVGDMHHVARGLRERRLDAGIVYLVPELLRDMLQYALYDETYCLVSPAPSGLASSRPITWSQASRLPLALLSPDMLNRRLIDKVFEDLGIVPTIRLQSDSILSLLTHVEKGLCAAIVPRSSLSSLPSSAGLMVQPLVEPVVRHGVGLVMLRETSTTPWGQQLDTLFRSANFVERFTPLTEAATIPS